MGKSTSIDSIVYRRFPKGNPYRSIEESPKQQRVARIVKKMQERLGHPESVMFYRKCAWHMSEDEIFSRIDAAISGHKKGKIRNTLAFFIYDANKLLKERCDD